MCSYSVLACLSAPSFVVGNLTCIDLQFPQQQKEVRRTDSLPSGVLSGFCDGSLQLAEWSSSSNSSVFADMESAYLPSTVRTWRIPDYPSTVRSVKFHPTRPTQVVVAADYGFLGLYDTRFIKEVADFSSSRFINPLIVFKEHISTFHCTPPSMDPFGSDLMVCAGEDGMVRFWNTSTGRLVNAFMPFPDAHELEATSLKVAYTSHFQLMGREGERDKDGRFEGQALLVVSQYFAHLYVAGVPDFVQPT